MKNKLNDLKVIFMGTPEFSVPILTALIANCQVIGTVTQPDKKVGRKQILTPSPIKQIAEENNIEVLQPEKIKGNQEFLKKIKSMQPDLIVVAAYGFILPLDLLNIPRLGVINVHASLLPQYRGASPIQSAILNGDQKTGVTVMLINEKMDQGDILSAQAVELDNDETFKTLHDKLSILGAHLLIDTLLKYINNEIEPVKQDDSKATYCQLIKKEDGRIDWQKSAEEIERQVRAFDPWPGTWTEWAGKKVKILSVIIGPDDLFAEVGSVVKYNNNLIVKCKHGSLGIVNLQMEGKKLMPAKEFINGYPEIINSVLK